MRKPFGSFRLLLFVGAGVSIALGVWGVVWTGMLDSVLGLRAVDGSPGFGGLARLFGGLMLAVGVGYALAAAHPQRNRGLLVLLFLVPFATAVMAVAAAAREEMGAVNGAVFAAYNFAFCLVFFRLYPRLPREEARFEQDAGLGEQSSEGPYR